MKKEEICKEVVEKIEKRMTNRGQYEWDRDEVIEALNLLYEKLTK